MDQQIVQIWKFLVQQWQFLRKSREEQKAELDKRSLDVFKALDTLELKEKKELLPYVKDLYNDLMEIEVLRLKVNLIAIPLLSVFTFIVWVFVVVVIFGVLDLLTSFLFSTNLTTIQSFLETQSRNGNIWAAIGYLVFTFGGGGLCLFVSAIITAYIVLPIPLAYRSFFERLRNARYPVASLVNKLIWILQNAERYRLFEQVGFAWKPLVTIVWYEGKQKTDDFRTPLCILVASKENGSGTPLVIQAHQQIASKIFNRFRRDFLRPVHTSARTESPQESQNQKNNCIYYWPYLISKERDLKTSEPLGEETTNTEKAYRTIAKAVLERKLTVEDLKPFPQKKGEEGEREEGKPKSRTKILAEYKQNQLSLLEGAARCLERYVPHQFHGGDAVTDHWLKETFQLAAAALREKKAWILTPKMDTYDNLPVKIASTLKCAVKDNWDALERVKMEEMIKRQKLARSQLWRFRLIALLRAVFVAILPVAGFILLQLTPLAITGATRTYVIVGLFIWVGLSALTLVDVDLEKKLGMANTIKSLLSFPGKNEP